MRKRILFESHLRSERHVMETSKQVVINREWCKGCGICEAFCPKKVLALDHQEKACWDHPEDCIRCGLCEQRCPDMAIELEETKP